MRKLIEILFVFLFVTLVSVHAKLNPYDMVHRDLSLIHIYPLSVEFPPNGFSPSCIGYR